MTNEGPEPTEALVAYLAESERRPNQTPDDAALVEARTLLAASLDDVRSKERQHLQEKGLADCYATAVAVAAAIGEAQDRVRRSQRSLHETQEEIKRKMSERTKGEEEKRLIEQAQSRLMVSDKESTTSDTQIVGTPTFRQALVDLGNPDSKITDPNEQIVLQDYLHAFDFKRDGNRASQLLARLYPAEANHDGPMALTREERTIYEKALILSHCRTSQTTRRDEARLEALGTLLPVRRKTHFDALQQSLEDEARLQAVVGILDEKEAADPQASAWLKAIREGNPNGRREGLTGLINGRTQLWRQAEANHGWKEPAVDRKLLWVWSNDQTAPEILNARTAGDDFRLSQLTIYRLPGPIYGLAAETFLLNSHIQVNAVIEDGRFRQLTEIRESDRLNRALETHTETLRAGLS